MGYSIGCHATSLDLLSAGLADTAIGLIKPNQLPVRNLWAEIAKV